MTNPANRVYEVVQQRFFQNEEPGRSRVSVKNAEAGEPGRLGN
jgi:hypothetical protein